MGDLFGNFPDKSSFHERIAPKNVYLTSHIDGAVCSYDVENFIKKRAQTSPTSITASIQESNFSDHFLCNDYIVQMRNHKDCEALLQAGRNSDLFQVTRGTKKKNSIDQRFKVFITAIW